MTLSTEDVTGATTAFTTLEGLLNTLPSVSDGDRKHFPKIGLKNEAIALQAIEVGRLNLDLIPRGLDFAMIDRDIKARAQVTPLLIQSLNITDRLIDAKLLLGVDIYAAALAIYHSLKRNARSASARAAVDELTRAFARAKKEEEEEQQPTTPGGGTTPNAVVQG